MTETRYCREPGLAVLRLSGADASRFLHAQTTQRIDDLAQGQTRLAAWLSARGRVRALFDVIRADPDFVLLLPADQAPMVATNLSRYVLRDRVRIEPAPDCRILTLCGAIDDWLASRGIELPPGTALAVDGALLARTGVARLVLIAEAEVPDRLLAGLAEGDADTAALAAIAEGRPEIPAALAERYVPQMLNLDRLGAISFNKGCYPGQEIVARTQNLGEVKRRLRRLRTTTGARPAPGDRIVDLAGQDVGEVNRSAATPEGFEILAVVGIEAEREGLRLATDLRALRDASTT